MKCLGPFAPLYAIASHVLIICVILSSVEPRKHSKSSATLQYDFGHDKGSNFLLLKTDSLFPEMGKTNSKSDSLNFEVKKSNLITKKESNRKLKKEIAKRKKIERKLRREKKKWARKLKKKSRTLMLGMGDEKEQKIKQLEDMSAFKKLEKSSFRDSLNILFSVAQKFKNMPSKIGTLTGNIEEELGYKEEAVDRALESIDVHLGD